MFLTFAMQRIFIYGTMGSNKTCDETSSLSLFELLKIIEYVVPLSDSFFMIWCMIDTYGFVHVLDISWFILYIDILLDISGLIMITMVMLILCFGLIIEVRFVIVFLFRTCGSCLLLIMILLAFADYWHFEFVWYFA